MICQICGKPNQTTKICWDNLPLIINVLFNLPVKDKDNKILVRGPR